MLTKDEARRNVCQCQLVSRSGTAGLGPLGGRISAQLGLRKTLTGDLARIVQLDLAHIAKTRPQIILSLFTLRYALSCLAASRRPGLPRNWTLALSCATTTGSSWPTSSSRSIGPTR
jgi:hypothetical protein